MSLNIKCSLRLQAFAKEGAKVTATDINGEKLRELDSIEGTACQICSGASLTSAGQREKLQLIYRSFQYILPNFPDLFKLFSIQLEIVTMQQRYRFYLTVVMVINGTSPLK